VKGEYSIMLIYVCEQCGNRELKTKVFKRPNVTMPASPREIGIVHLVDVDGQGVKDVHWEPLEFLHQCKTKSTEEEVFGLCKFIGYAKKEW